MSRPRKPLSPQRADISSSSHRRRSRSPSTQTHRPPRLGAARAVYGRSSFLRSKSGSLAKFAAVRRASLLLGREEPWRENFTEFVLFNPRAARRAVMRTVAGKHENLADVLVGEVDAVVRQLQALAQRRQRRLGGRALGHEANI